MVKGLKMEEGYWFLLFGAGAIAAGRLSAPIYNLCIPSPPVCSFFGIERIQSISSTPPQLLGVQGNYIPWYQHPRTCCYPALGLTQSKHVWVLALSNGVMPLHRDFFSGKPQLLLGSKMEKLELKIESNKPILKPSSSHNVFCVYRWVCYVLCLCVCACNTKHK